MTLGSGTFHLGSTQMAHRKSFSIMVQSQLVDLLLGHGEVKWAYSTALL